MPKIFCEMDIRIAIVFGLIVMTFIIIGAILWGMHPPIVGGGE